MANGGKTTDQGDDLPKNLQAIEIVLAFLNDHDSAELSIRSIAENTTLSIRVAKNILLHLENMGQASRIVRKNGIIPKWRITEFGKRVIDQSRSTGKKAAFASIYDELMQGITIPADPTIMIRSCKEKQEIIEQKLKELQVDLSKSLGIVLYLAEPVLEDFTSFVVARIKYLKQRMSMLPTDPIAIYKIKKKDGKNKNISKADETNLVIQLYILDSLILNQVNRLLMMNQEFLKLVENGAVDDAVILASQIREDIRRVTRLIYERDTTTIDVPILSPAQIKKLEKNKVDGDMIRDIIAPRIDDATKMATIKDTMLKILAMLDRGENHLEGQIREITDTIPLYSLYQLLRDELPSTDIEIEDVEHVVNDIASAGYIPGVKMIQDDDTHYMKVVQFKARDFSKDEQKLVLLGQGMKKFTVADMIAATGWDAKRITDALNALTQEGVLRYSRSYLQGECWYV